MDSSSFEALDSAHAPGRFATAVPAVRAPARPAWGSISASAGRAAVSSSRREDRARELALGRSLGLLRESELHLALGYVRLEHYLLDRLGMSLRTAQELMRTSAELESLPAVTAAFVTGEITAAHVRLLTRVATPADEEMWVARARRRSVRQLARDIAVASREGETGSEGGSNGDRAGTALACRMIDPDPLPSPLRMRAPAWIASMWRDVRVRVRRLAGSMLPAGACLEALLAEASAGGWQPPGIDGDDLHVGARTEDGGGELQGRACEGWRSEEAGGIRARVEAGSASVTGASEPAGPSITGAGGGAHEREHANGKAGRVRPDGAADRGSSPSGRTKRRHADPLFPRKLDGELRRLVFARHEDEVRLAATLAGCRRWKSHLIAGFESLEAFALERHGLTPRRLYYLLALHRDLDRLSGLRLAFLGGRVTLRKALLVAKVASPGTAEAWIRRAESVSFRRFDDEVESWTHLRDTRYEVWRLLKGRPLPHGIALEPGKEPRLHVSASADGATEGSAGADVSGSDLHMSASGDDAESGSEEEDAAGSAGDLHVSASREGAAARSGDAEDGFESRLHVSASRQGSASCARIEEDDSGDRLHVSARPDLGERASAGADDLRKPVPQPSSFAESVTAASFLAALQADERLTPLPERMVDVEMYVEPDVLEQWNARVAELRASIRPDLQEWEVLAFLMHHFLTTWDTRQTRRQIRENPILERGGWRCAVPGCRNLGTGNLQVHHVTFRSHGGAVGDPSNEIPVCSAHHLISIHRGVVRVTGRAPDGLRWEMGLVPGRPDLGAFQVFGSGDVLVR